MHTAAIYQRDKKRTITQFVLVCIALVLINVLSFFWHAKLDLTADQRFSLTQPTKQLVRSAVDVVSVRVLLNGNLPSGYTKLVQGTTDVLNALRDASGKKVQFTFENPLPESSNLQEKTKAAEVLKQKGIMPMPITTESDNELAQEKKYIFPYAIVSANGSEEVVCLMENRYGEDMNGILNYSESVLEYKFATAIKKCLKPQKPVIAYIVGHGEALNYNTLDALYTLAENYEVDTFDITKGIEIPSAYSCVVICKPTVAWDEKSKFKLDQYIMHGGRMLLMADAVNCNLDTMQKNPTYMALSYELNLDDMLLKYGCRLNNNLIEDIQCNEIPLTIGMIGDKPDIRPFPWLYFPFLTTVSKHPVVNNLDAICCRFAGTIDTIPNKDNTKTILFGTSQYSRAMPAPVTVSFNMVRQQPNRALYTKSNLPVAVAIEGGFSSLYENRIDPGFIKIYQDSLHKKYAVHTAQPTKMIVVSDADIMLNEVDTKRGPAELGYYVPMRKLFANKTFLLNCVEYLTDDNNLLEARSKSVQLRMLDKQRVDDNKGVIQLLNIALPVLIVLFLGSAYFFFRRKKYEQNITEVSK